MRYIILVLLAFIMMKTSNGQDATTAPQFLVDARIEDTTGDSKLLIASRLFYTVVKASFHSKLETNQPYLSDHRLGTGARNQKQDVSILESEIVTLNPSYYEFQTVSGDQLSVDDVRERLKSNSAILILPIGAALHPSIAAILTPEAVVARRVGQRHIPQRIVDRPN